MKILNGGLKRTESGGKFEAAPPASEFPFASDKFAQDALDVRLVVFAAGK